MLSECVRFPFALPLSPFALSEFRVCLQDRFRAAVSEMQTIGLAGDLESLLSEGIARLGLATLHHLSNCIHGIHHPDLAGRKSGNEIWQVVKSQDRRHDSFKHLPMNLLVHDGLVGHQHPLQHNLLQSFIERSRIEH